jgi:uncharacterized protein (DUF924 family)
MKDTCREVLDFWFVQSSPSQWFQKNQLFDDLIIDQFSEVYKLARDGLCDSWASDVDGALALILVLDQFPRNMFRGKPESFATDAKALDVAKQSIDKGFDQIVTPPKRRFFYLPFEHSEDVEDQKACVAFFEAMKEDDPLGYDYALRHLRVIEQFGRFPHRNSILGRTSTVAELDYLSRDGAGF